MPRIKPVWVRLWLALSLFSAFAVTIISMPFDSVPSIGETMEEMIAVDLPVKCDPSTVSITLEESDGAWYKFCFANRAKVNEFWYDFNRASDSAKKRKWIEQLLKVAGKTTVVMLALIIFALLTDWVARGAHRGFLFSEPQNQQAQPPLIGLDLSPRLKHFGRSTWLLTCITITAWLAYILALDMTWVNKGLSAYGDRPLSGFMLALPILILTGRGPHWFQVLCSYLIFVVPAVMLWYPIERAMGEIGLLLYGALAILIIEGSRLVSPKLQIGDGRFAARSWQLAFSIPTLFASLVIAIFLGNLLAPF